MDIFKRHFVPTPMASGSDSVLSTSVLLTDRDEFARWGSTAGLVVIQMDIERLAAPDELEKLLSRLDASRAHTVLCALSGECPTAIEQYPAVSQCAQVFWALLQGLIGQSRAVALVGLRRRDALAASVLDGLGLSACQETTRLSYASLIVEGELTSRLTQAIATVLDQPGVRHRFDGQTLAREHLEPVGNPVESSPRSTLRHNGCYVVTGGGGGVGRLLCQWLAREYQAKVCVVGRSSVDDERRAMLLAHGVTSYVQADVADRQALAGALNHFKDRYGAIDGVFHLAGTTADRLLINKNSADIERVLLPKIAGSLNLWALDSLIQPGFVCHFSSLSGLVGNVGQADYAAANGFIDELTDFVSRQAPAGRACWQSINWGLWASEGMQMAEGSSELLPLSDEQGLAALRTILDQAAPRLVAFAGSRAVLGALNTSSGGKDVKDAAAAVSLPSLSQVSEWIGSLVYTFSGLRDVAHDASLVALGVTSSTLISIVSALEHRLNGSGVAVSLSKALIFDYSSVTALSEYLLGTQPQALAAAFASEGADPSRPLPAIETIAPTPGAHINFEDRLTQWVQEVVRRFSGITDPSLDDNLLQRGLDSVASINIATELARRLSTQAPVSFSKTLLFEYSSISQMVRFLIDRYPAQIAAVLDTAVARTVPGVTSAAVTATVAVSPVVDVASGFSAHYRPDDIAIVGVAGEFPGADNLAQLWVLLESGAEAISVIPAQRWDWQLDYSADPKQPGASYGRHGGFLRRAKQFDPAFFSITPIEAARIDPQERRLLEMAYHALEDAGHFADPLEDTGVFTAAMFGHYQNLNAANAVSSSFASIANRISYTFNLQGPSLCVDTMCSGSLTALHLAINSLRSGECTQALVGAVNIMPHPGKFKLLSAGRFLSPSGRCHSFGIEADGYVPGEGAIALMLKPLAQAQANGDRIHGVIRATALNSGGRSSGFTVPSARAQEKVIRQALSKAGVDASQIDYVEAHGTGTRLGDPIEINALSAAYGTRQGERRCIGSIKSNIGHLESAAGLAGLVKILLQFQHQSRVPTLNCEIENPWLNLGDTDLRLPRTTEPWTADTPLLAGLSSFGAGGSNAHVIVQQYIDAPLAPAPQAEYLLPVSARTPLALKARINDLLAWIDKHPQASLAAVAYTLGVTREHFGHRACFVGDSLARFKQQLLDAAAGVSVVAQSRSTLQPLQASYLAGETLNFAALHDSRRLVSLPHYPFEEQSYWDDQLVTSGPAGADLLKPEGEDVPALAKASVPVCFQAVWESQPVQASGGARGQGAIVFCNPSQARALIGQPHIVVVTLGDSLRLDEHFAQVRSDSIDDCQQVLQRYAPGDGSLRPWLINLLQSSAEDMQAAWARWQFTLAKAISAAGARYRMAFVHEEGLEVWPMPAAGAVSRLFRVLQMEQPEFELLSMTVASQDFEHVPELLVSVLSELANVADGFNATRHVAGERWQARIREVPWPVAAGSRFRNKGVYLITGGLGLIGLAVAARLIRQFDATVVLVGRSAAGEATRDKLAGLAAPANVDYISADIGDSVAVNDLIKSVIARHGALHGVLHAAGIICDGLLRNKQLEDFQKVIAVKLNGARHLDNATADVALDFFVLFSSISGLFGNVGQADYAVANHYLDLFAFGRQRQVTRGRRCGLSLSVNWPLWQGTDDPVLVALGRYFHDNYGMQPLTPAAGVDLLVRLIDGVDGSMTQIAPFVGDSEKIRRSVTPDGLRSHSALKPGAVNATKTISESATLEQLKLRLKALVSALTGLLPQNIDDQCSFGDLGLNSVMLQQLAQDIEEQFKVPMAPSTLFTYNSVAQLIEYLHERGAQAAAPVSAPELQAHLSSAPMALSAGAAGAAGADDQRIAIIGMDGRLPGGQDLAGFWEGLMANRSAIKAVERWPDKARHAGIIPEIGHFDARFFGISAREAMLMDPQHRLFLQACYNTLLDAGYAPSSLKRVGVFAGVQFSDYQTLLQRSGQSFHPFAATGNAHAMLANRVSYLFDFEGPSQSIDTACSSALVAVNRAVMSLQRGECDYALAGAVSLLIDSDMTEAAQSMGVLSPNFRCATFDSEADGYVRAEGVGSLLLKRLVDARRDGDSIHAVIEAAEENHGGRANSLTAPNPNAQKRLLLAAYTPPLAARVSYIETHGTGTRLGDPVEIDALKGAWHTLAPGQTQPVLLGSVKTNVGHLEPAAAIASLFKVILAFKHRVLPANLHLRTLNPYIDFEHSPFQVLDRNTPWEGHDRVAGISSFGFGGTNAHVVLSEPPAFAVQTSSTHEEHLIVLSARSHNSLLAMKEALFRHLDSPLGRSQALADIALTLGAGREHFEYRLAWSVPTVDALLHALRAEQTPDVHHVGRGTEPAEIDRQWPDLREQYLHGGAVQWSTLYPQAGRLHLPGYAFDTRRYWFDDDSQVHPGNR
ncbi:SDR family NAD(P)-dependent oxidoreductase [Pseudomonas sp. XS1P51]